MAEAWAPRDGTVVEAFVRFKRDYETLSRDLRGAVCDYVVECGTPEDMEELRQYLMLPDFPSNEEAADRNFVPFPTHAELYHCAVRHQQFDRLSMLLEKEDDAAQFGDLIRWAYLEGECLTPELFDVVRSAPNFRFPRHMWHWVSRSRRRGLSFLQEWFPEHLDFSNQETMSSTTFDLVGRSLTHNNWPILEAFTAQIPHEEFFRTKHGKELLHGVCGWHCTPRIKLVLEWVPRDFLRIRDDKGRTPLERYMTPPLVYDPVTKTKIFDVLWVPSPEIVALLSVHTKGAIE